MRPRTNRSHCDLPWLALAFAAGLVLASCVVQVDQQDAEFAEGLEGNDTRALLRTPAPAFDVKPSRVGVDTQAVAQLPRPPRVKGDDSRDCAARMQRGLRRWDKSWLHADGTVEIPAGAKVLVRGNDDIPAQTLIRRLRIPAGSELVFADQDTSLRVTDIAVAGALRFGSPTCRLQRKFELVFDTDEPLSDPAVRRAIYDRQGLGIVVEDGGVLEMFGRLYQPTWTRLAQTAAAGASEISVAEEVNWEVGQQVVVVTSSNRDYPYADENEVRSIRALRGKRISLQTPLAHRHYGGREYQVEVGLLSRSILLRSSDAVLAAGAGFGAHIMVEAAQARVSGVELRGFGQRNMLGRYPFHFHHSGDLARSSYFTDSSVWRSNWRCVAIHGTTRALVSRNVAFDVYGHCYYLEDGREVGNELSFNLAAGIKIMGPVDQAALDAMNAPGQDGFEQLASDDLVNPADRAASGFYIANGSNDIVGNAASGGFAGYSFPTLPTALGHDDDGMHPFQYPVNHFDGNSAHSAGYFWTESACVYVGGLLEQVQTESGLTLRYRSGRIHDSALLRQSTDLFANTKTFLCSTGITHWGNYPRVVNFESRDNELLAKVFGSASIRSALVEGETANTPNLAFGPLNWFRRGFQFYDTGVQTILRGIVFRGFHPADFPGAQRSDDNCALYTTTHSDEYTPQNMNATAEIYFDKVDQSQRFCHNDSGTLASRNFNAMDTDGTMTRVQGDGLQKGPRIVGSAYNASWHLSPSCVLRSDWGLWVCPKRTKDAVAAVATRSSQGVRVQLYDLTGNSLGENWYSPSQDLIDAQITGPAGVDWHHAFPSGVPETFGVQSLQIPDKSFVLYSFSMPPGMSCAVPQAGWSPQTNLASLLAARTAGYTTDRQTCFIYLPPTNLGNFEAEGLSIPNMTWRGNPLPHTHITVTTSCSADAPDCRSLPAPMLPALP